MAETKQKQKLTLEEYQQKYNNPENMKAAKSFVAILTMLIAVVFITTLFFVVLRIYEINEIAGHVSAGVAILIFIFAYIVPIVKIKNMKSFQTFVNKTNAREAQKYNKALREDIADKMIDLTYNTEGVGWYSDKNISALALARHSRKDAPLKEALSEIYKTDVKKAAEKIIRRTAVQVGVTTALSQSSMLDTLLMVTYELNLIKDIVYLYGYRPNEAQMARIYKNVIQNALITYGVSSATSNIGKSIGSGIVSAFDKAAASSSVITSAIGSLAGALAGTAIESGIQFAINSTLTVIIGYQTKRYLVREYNLQDVLDDIEVFTEDEKEEIAVINSIKKEVKETLAKKPNPA